MTDPVQRYKCGACIAAVFENDVASPDGPKSMRRVSVQRVYKDKEGNFKYTPTFKTNDIPKLILALQKAFDFLTSYEKPPEPQHATQEAQAS